MQSHQLRSSTAYFLRSKARFAPFLDTVQKLAEYAAGIENLVLVAAQGKSEITNLLQKHFAQIGSVLASVDYRKFYKAHEAFEGELEDLWSPNLEEPGELPHYHQELTAAMEQFLDLYNKHLTGPTNATSMTLIVAAQKLQPRIDATFQLLEAVKDSLEPEIEANEGETELSLYLPSNMSVRDFAARLAALQSLYSKMCELLQVNEVDYPLRVAELESGSLWLKVFGNEKVLGFISVFIGKAAQWGFRNFTKEGRLGSVPHKVDAVEKLFGLTLKLKEAGIDVAAIEENIRNATVSLSKDLETIIAGQACVTVNAQTIKLSDELQKQSAQALALPDARADSSAAPPTSPMLPGPNAGK